MTNEIFAVHGPESGEVVTRAEVGDAGLLELLKLDLGFEALDYEAFVALGAKRLDELVEHACDPRFAN